MYGEEQAMCTVPGATRARRAARGGDGSGVGQQNLSCTRVQHGQQRVSGGMATAAAAVLLRRQQQREQQQRRRLAALGSPSGTTVSLHTTCLPVRDARRSMAGELGVFAKCCLLGDR